MSDRGRRASDRLLAAEALAWLFVARAALNLFSFARIAAWAARPAPRGRPASALAARRIGWAIEAAARRAPFDATCFVKGLAAQAMLRRRRLPARLFYGARNEGALGPVAHVWVRSSEEDVVGAEVAAQFALLAAFPPL
jgi:hypothetical protein